MLFTLFEVGLNLAVSIIFMQMVWQNVLPNGASLFCAYMYIVMWTRSEKALETRLRIFCNGQQRS